MKDIFQTIQDAFPFLRNHPIAMARILLVFLILAIFYSAKSWRHKTFRPVCYRLHSKIFKTSRWLYVYQDSQLVNDWKYYTSEVTGKGNAGDDVIWTLVKWPSLKPIDSFRIAGGVGMVSGIHESRTKLKARWQITHDPDRPSIGMVPARGIMGKLRRFLALVLGMLETM